MTQKWYALHVKPHKERMVCEGLRARDMEVFYPALKKQPVNPRARKEVPFYPGYIFIQLDLTEVGLNALRWTEGTHGVVEFGGIPAAVPEIMIQELKKRLIKIKTSSTIQSEDIQPGDSVKIVKGPFDGYEAIFDAQLSGNDRIQVMLTYLRAQPKKLQLSSSEILKIRR
jgi:transcription antitermination factor NusG